MLAVILAFLLLAVVAVARASADVNVRIAPEQQAVQVRSQATYDITVTTDTPVVLSDVWGMIPGQGQPCGQADELGEPYGNDPDSQFTVLTPGVLVAGRTFTFPGDFTLTPDAPLSLTLDVLTPDIAACFYVGSSAHIDPSYLGVDVSGIAQGGQLTVTQHADFGTGGYFSWEPRHWRLYWYAYTQTAGCVETWRLGLPAGFTLIDSSLGAGKQRNVASFSRQWSTERCLAAGESAYEWVTVSTTLCSNQGATVHARLRVWRDDGVIAGTGDGPALQLEAC